MNTPNNILMDQALQSLEGKWRLAIKVTFLYLLIIFVINALPLVGSVASFIVSGPFAVGLTLFWVSFSRNTNPDLSQIFKGFDTFIKSFTTYLLMLVYIVLWSLLLIVPGIIAALAYSQTYFILNDNPTFTPDQAITKSKALMMGHKWKFFCLQFRFLGWILLCILTLGIGFLWLSPYMSVTMAKFYDDIKNKDEVDPTIPKAITVPQA